MVQYNTLSTGNPVFNYAVFKSSGGEVSWLQLRLVIGAVRCRSGFLARVRGPLPRFGHRAWLRGAHGMKPPTEKTAVTIPVQCHRSSRAAHGADFYGATDLLADNRSGPNCAMVNTYEKQEK